MLDRLIQDGDVAQRKILVDTRDRCTQSSSYIHARLDEHIHPVPAFLTEWEKEQRLGVIVIQTLYHVCRDADYCNPISGLVIVVVKAEALSNRGLVRPDSRRAIISQNRGLVAGSPICAFEVAAKQER